MKYVAAYLLVILGGNPSPDIESIAKILASVGIECDEKRAEQVINACKGRNVEEIIADGMTKVDNTMLNMSTETNPQSSSNVSPVEIPIVSNGNKTPPDSPIGDEPFGFDLFN